MKVGIYLNGVRMIEYNIEDYQEALESLAYVYKETGSIHELKIVNE